MHRRTFFVSLAGAVVSGASGCGTLLHNERCGQPHSRDLDWKIVALDGLGLLLFFVPGVVAFVVDFYTGAIYLPAEPACPPGPHPAPLPGYPPGYPAPEYTLPPDASQPSYPLLLPAPPQAAYESPQPWEAGCRPQLARVVVPREELTPARIEQVVSRHTGRPIVLAGSQTRLSPLPALDQYPEQCRRHQSDGHFGFGIQKLLQRWRATRA